MKIGTVARLADMVETQTGCRWSAAGSGTFAVSILEPWLARVVMRPDGAPRLDRTWMIQGTIPAAVDPIPKEGRSRDDEAVFSCPPPQRTASAGHQSLSTDNFSVEVDELDASLTWKTPSGDVFAEDVPGRAYCFDRRGSSVFHYLRRSPSEAYYGFGERAGPLNKRGMRMRMHNLDALGYNAAHGDPLYKHWPIYITYLPDQGLAYGLIYDNLSDTIFDMGKEIDAYHGDYRYYHAAAGDIDYYLVFGPTIEQVVERISLLIGRIELPPRWTLGYLGSGMGYTDSPNAAMRLDDFVDECRRHRIPCDMFHLSSGYSMSNDGKRYVFVWNRNRVPDPNSVADTFHAAGMRVVANIKPCLLLSHPEYKEAEADDVFLCNDEGPYVADFWGGKGSYIDFTSPSGYRWWQERVRSRILDYGIDATWNDNNEYEVWDDDVECNGFGAPIPIAQVRPLHSLLMTRASYEVQRSHRPERRPYVLCRSGCPGIQRYAQTWSGDNSTSWETLKYNIPMGLGFGLTGQPNTGHDVGGFWGSVPDPELLVRWVQNGIFHPRFSIHSWRLDGTATEPWSYPEVIDIIRDAIEFRYRLIPYLYSLYVEAAQSGHPIVRPLVYHYSHDPNVVEESFDFMLGADLLIVAVFEPECRQREIYLPAGDRWCDFFTGSWYDGGTRVTVATPFERPTLLARQGAIIPCGKPMNRVDAKQDDVRELMAFPHRDGTRSVTTLIDDDGETQSYRSGARSALTVSLVGNEHDISCVVSRNETGYKPVFDRLTLVLPPGDTRVVTHEKAVPLTPDALGRSRFEIPVPSL